MPRLFVEPPRLAEPIVTVSGEDHRYLTRVLRVGLDDVVTLLRAGADDARVRALMAAAHAATPSRPSPAPVIALVPREPPPDYWIATIVPDAGATATQVVRAVIAGRQLLGVSAVGVMPSQARRGDWVCFYVPGSGVVGHARLRGQADRASQLRDGRRFAAIYAIDGVQLYPRPNALDLTSPLQRLATRTPPDPAGPFLSQIEEADFRMLTSTSDARRHAERTPDA